jgi:type VI protein secretion system component Hcp
MSSTPLIGRINFQIRILALVLAAALLAVSAVALGGRSSGPSARAPHYLGMRGMELAAFSGKEALYLDMPPITTLQSRVTHAGDITLTRMAWGVRANNASPGSGVGQLTVADMDLSKVLDQFTVPLLTAAATNERISTATVWVVRKAANGQPLEQLSYTLAEPEVVGDTNSATEAGGAETVELNFTSIAVAYWRGTTKGKTVQIKVGSPG